MKRGPKPTRGEPATRVIHIRITQAEREDLQRVAKENHTTVAGVIREAVNEYAADYRDDSPVFRNP